jgi:hypothetical protein
MDETTVAALLGEELQQLRSDLGLREAARLIGISHSTLARYEMGGRAPSPKQLAKILDAYKVDDPHREQLLAMIRRDAPARLVSGVPSTGLHLAQLIGFERAATRITDVSPLMIPGLLQTRSYAQVVLSKVPDTDRRVRMRMERAEIITRPEQPVQLRAIIHQEALTSRIAPPEVMGDQLRHLLTMTTLPNVTIQVVPDSAPGWLPSHVGPFILLEFAEAPSVVHVEYYRTSVFLWDTEDVRGFLAAADRITQAAMTPARTTEIIKELTKEQP